MRRQRGSLWLLVWYMVGVGGVWESRAWFEWIERGHGEEVKWSREHGARACRHTHDAPALWVQAVPYLCAPWYGGKLGVGWLKRLCDVCGRRRSSSRTRRVVMI